MTIWGKSLEVEKLPDILSADSDLIYVLPDKTEWISSANWKIHDPPIWRPLEWAFGIPCRRCGGSGSCETELYEGLTRCPDCVPDPDLME